MHNKQRRGGSLLLLLVNKEQLAVVDSNTL